MVGQQGGFAGHRLDHRNAPALGEVGDDVHRPGVMNSAAGDDERVAGGGDRADGRSTSRGSGPGLRMA